MNHINISRRNALGLIAGGTLISPNLILGNSGSTITITVRSGGNFSTDNPMASPPPASGNSYCYTDTGNSKYHNNNYNIIAPHLGPCIKGRRVKIGIYTYPYYVYGNQLEFKASFPANNQSQYQIAQVKRVTANLYDGVNIKTITQEPLPNYSDLSNWANNSSGDGYNNHKRVGNNKIYAADAPGFTTAPWHIPNYPVYPNQPPWDPSIGYTPTKMVRELVLRTFVTPNGVTNPSQRVSSNYIQSVLRLTLVINFQNGVITATHTKTLQSKTNWDDAPF